MIRLQSRPAAVLVCAIVLALAGCTPKGSTPPPDAIQSSTPAGSATAPTPGGTASGSPTTSPTLAPTGSAAANLPFFTGVVRSVWAGPDQVAGRAYIDALVAAGFDKAAMQVTPDETTIGNPADSIEFAVRWGEDCLVGQVGPSTGDPVTTVLPGLSTGGCLIGETRTIDW
ncbi:DUF6993 domain-containing protein [Microbacterium sp. NPDC016588]